MFLSLRLWLAEREERKLRQRCNLLREMHSMATIDPSVQIPQGYDDPLETLDARAIEDEFNKVWGYYESAVAHAAILRAQARMRRKA